MPAFKRIVEVKDRPWNRAVKVTITAPTLDGIGVRDLVQRA